MIKLFKYLFYVDIPHSLKYNPNIDGLRGISIILVLLFHYFPKLFSFGFVGVDIFYLVSGYLITRIIVSKLTINEFSLALFYRNRIRRLAPALIIVLTFSLVIGYIFLFPGEYSNLGKHIESSAFYYQNFALLHEIGYWDKASILKPLIHLWSLSIEEQFYLIWPFLLICLYKIKKLNGISLGALFMLLLTIAIHLAHKSPEASFYNTAGRGWELAMGGGVGY